MIPDKTKLQDMYRLRFTKSEKYRNEVWQILCQEYLCRLISSEANIIDIGSGWGEFINNIKAAKKYAMDMNPDTGERLSRDIHFIHQDCAQEWPIQKDSLDVVFSSNFFEHLPDKNHIESTISEAYRCLKLNGLIICLGPNIKFAPGKYWDFWDHLIPITELSLSELLQLKGFSIHTCKPRFLPYTMSNKLYYPLFLLKMYLKIPFIWPFFGKQFLVVGIKKRECI
jgi:SAM-dependent methyltransferase